MNLESNGHMSHRGLAHIRTYGIILLGALFALNAIALGALKWIELNELHDELSALSERFPSPGSPVRRDIVIPEDVIMLKTTSTEHVGFYEIEMLGKDWLAYANPSKQFILMKSEDEINREIRDFSLALFVLYLGEVALLLGWWHFVRAKVHGLFETV